MELLDIITELKRGIQEAEKKNEKCLVVTVNRPARGCRMQVVPGLVGQTYNIGQGTTDIMVPISEVRSWIKRREKTT